MSMKSLWGLSSRKQASQTHPGIIPNLTFPTYHNEGWFSNGMLIWVGAWDRISGPSHSKQPGMGNLFVSAGQRHQGRQMRGPAEASCQFGPGSLFVASGLRISLPPPFGATRAGTKYKQGDPTMPFSHWETPSGPGRGHPFHPIRQHQPRPVRAPVASGTPNKSK